MSEANRPDEVQAAFHGTGLSPEFKRGWLCGFFDGEGCAPSLSNRRITASNCDPRLIVIAMTFLDDFKIRSRAEKHGTPIGNRKPALKISITGYGAMAKFARLIGFRERRKQDRLLGILAAYKQAPSQ